MNTPIFHLCKCRLHNYKMQIVCCNILFRVKVENLKIHKFTLYNSKRESETTPSFSILSFVRVP